MHTVFKFGSKHCEIISIILFSTLPQGLSSVIFRELFITRGLFDTNPSNSLDFKPYPWVYIFISLKLHSAIASIRDL